MRDKFAGLVVIDKPAGITSRDAVNRAQKWFPRGTRLGHAGTLDPLATGVLVLSIGLATRLTEYVQRMPKVYRAGIVLGATSDTDDADGNVTPTPNPKIPMREEMERALVSFVGAREQVPPAYSAAKVAGRRAYDLARKGEDVALAPRTVEIYQIDLLDFQYPQLEIRVRCGKGTYIRSLARDLGQLLGCGGYIATLRRLEIGPFTIADAVPMDAAPAEARERMLPMAQAIQDLPRLTLSSADVFRLRQGQRIAISSDGPEASGTEQAVFDDEGRLVAIAHVVDGWLCPHKVLPIAVSG